MNISHWRQIFSYGQVCLALILSCTPFQHPDSKPSLIGGELADPEQFPALIAIADCGAAKIAEHIFLTAAHCVVDSLKFNLEAGYQEGSKLTISTHARRDNTLELTIDWIKVHHDYAEAFLKVHKDSSVKIKKIAPKDFDSVEDLALIRFVEKTPNIAIMNIYKDFINEKTNLKVAGWGRRYREIEDGSFVVSGPSSDLYTASVTIDKSDKKETVYSFKTQINEYYEPSLSLAPGDSGSPALIELSTGLFNKKKAWFVAGVNSFANSTRSSIARVDGARFQCISLEISKDSAQGSSLGLSEPEQLRTFCNTGT